MYSPLPEQVRDNRKYLFHVSTLHMPDSLFLVDITTALSVEIVGLLVTEDLSFIRNGKHHYRLHRIQIIDD